MSDILVYENKEFSNMAILKCHTVKNKCNSGYMQSALLLATRDGRSLPRYALVSVFKDSEGHWILTEIISTPLEFSFFGVDNFSKIPTLNELKQFEIDSWFNPFEEYCNNKYNIKLGVLKDDDQMEVINYKVFEENLSQLTND